MDKTLINLSWIETNLGSFKYNTLLTAFIKKQGESTRSDICSVLSPGGQRKLGGDVPGDWLSLAITPSQLWLIFGRTFDFCGETSVQRSYGTPKRTNMPEFGGEYSHIPQVERITYWKLAEVYVHGSNISLKSRHHQPVPSPQRRLAGVDHNLKYPCLRPCSHLSGIINQEKKVGT